MKTSRCKPSAGRRVSWWRRLLLSVLVIAPPAVAEAQALRHRGFVEGTLVAFPQETSTDTTRFVADVLARGEVFASPAGWLQLAGGADVRASSHDQVDDRWAVDFADRGALRPRLSVRRLSATLVRGPVSVDLGKQFVRWGAADIVNPTDRFAPRDLLNVVDTEFLGVVGARAVARIGPGSVEVVWTPRFTPSRMPAPSQRWGAQPPETVSLPIVHVSGPLPVGSQTGARWGYVGTGFQYSLSFFDGFNHVPDTQPIVRFSGESRARPVALDLVSVHPPLRTYGGDVTLPMPWFAVKAEAALFRSSSPLADEYGMYVLEIERQRGEWMFVAGYAGEVVTRRRLEAAVNPERGMTRAILARVSRTIDANSTLAVEGAVRQNGRGAYSKGEYSRAYGQHWRGTLAGVLIGGASDDWFGQYRRNSHVTVTARCSF